MTIEKIIKQRRSVRTYSKEAVSNEYKSKIESYASTLSNPFNIEINFKLLNIRNTSNSSKLGTYGVIKGATEYIGATVKNEDFALEALGYEFEKLIIYITSLGLGTCWLGGTFNKSEFSKAMNVKEDELFPIISPFGYPADKRSLTDSFVRFAAKGYSRKPWNELFFEKDFDNPLSQTGEYAKPLKMVRLAPSASNKQPWRIVKDSNNYHFYEYKSPGYSKALGYDIQRIDMGIAMCHFHLTAIENNNNGHFEIQKPISDMPQHTHYVLTWVSES